MTTDSKDPARTQALCWLLDDLLDAEDDLLALVARPGALTGWRRERLGAFCQRTGVALRGAALEREHYQILAELAEAEQSPRRKG
jgi:hypothetical protein